ncbi:unnamed protein product [Spirodela intermedia]|uniref:Uncharacterized protein n=1 Tax=Spirodela intermedia TaxID=51605 RepID=A0A7I8IG86_SPIIN|nr:unnamed protein product [Spirodela intermedia]CAA6656910.1 unnamed protein product [Spirodela intermedia]
MKPPSSWKTSRCPSCIVPLAFLVFIAVVYFEDFSCVLRPSLQPLQQLHSAGGVEEEGGGGGGWPFAVGETPAKCDLFSGEWVYDEVSRPLYQEEECPYIQPQLTCQEHGRPDRGYQHWRWQPRGCSLPRFNASYLLEMLRGRRMLFVGDSLNRGQFSSMACLLHRVIPEGAKSMETFDSLTVFRAKRRVSGVQRHRGVLLGAVLVESNSDNAIVHRVTDRIVRAGNIRRHSRHWEGADIIVFNTYLWWMTGAPMKILRGPFGGDMKNITLMETEAAYRTGLRSMVRWVERHMDPRKNRVFFATMSPSHETGSDWGGSPEENCYNQTAPIADPGYWGAAPVLGNSRFPIAALNITQLSEYRKDAHTQIYKRQWSPPTAEQLANPKSYADCAHWCLPGLQDTWNELLYAKLFFFP